MHSCRCMCVCVFECVCDVYHCGFHSPAPKAHTCTPYSATEVLYVCTPYRTGCPLSKDQSKEVYGPLLTQLPQHTYVSLFHQRLIIWNIYAESHNALSLFLALGTKQFVLSLWKLLNGPLFSKLAKDCKTVASAPTAQPMACSAQKLSRAAQSVACAQKLLRAANHLPAHKNHKGLHKHVLAHSNYEELHNQIPVNRKLTISCLRFRTTESCATRCLNQKLHNQSYALTETAKDCTNK